MVDQTRNRRQLQRWAPMLLVLSRQVHFTGYQSAGVVVLAASLIGSGFVFAFRVVIGSSFSTGALEILALLCIRSLAVQVPALIFCARSITAVISELSLMSVTGELRTLRRLGISRFRYLVVPRAIAAGASMGCLYIFFLVAALTSAVTVNSLLEGDYIDLLQVVYIFDNINPSDILIGVLRSALLAAVAILWVVIFEARGHTRYPQVSRAASFGVLRVMMLYLIAEGLFQLQYFNLRLEP